MQITKTRNDKDITSLLRQRKAKQKLNSKKLSKVIIDDVFIYEGRKYAKKNQDKYIVIKISSPDGLYSKKYILHSFGENIGQNIIIKKFKKLYKLKGKSAYTYIIPFKRQILMLQKPRFSSKSGKILSNFILDISSQIIFTTLFAISIFILPFVSISLIYLYIFLILIYFPISLIMSQKAHNKINRNRFNMKKFDNDISDSSNITNDIVKDINKNNDDIEYNIDEVTINTFEDNSVVLENSKAKWTFKPDEDVVSKDFLNIYYDYGGEFDTGDEISVQIAPYNNNILDDSAYLSDCGEWILKSDILNA